MLADCSHFRQAEQLRGHDVDVSILFALLTLKIGRDVRHNSRNGFATIEAIKAIRFSGTHVAARNKRVTARANAQPALINRVRATHVTSAILTVPRFGRWIEAGALEKHQRQHNKTKGTTGSRRRISTPFAMVSSGRFMTMKMAALGGTDRDALRLLPFLSSS